MLASIRRLFAHDGPPPSWQEAQRWARSRDQVFKRARDGEGFVIDGPGQPGWRLEWGPSQRDYIRGGELRLRGELGGGADLQMLVVSRLLMEALERQVFEEFTEGLQTRIDTTTPEEMRWLVLFPKLDAPQFKALWSHFGAVANAPEPLSSWLEGPLAQRLQEAGHGWLAADDRLVLIVQRGRLTLRTAMEEPDMQRFDLLVELFEVALEQARRVAGAAPAPGAPG